jgi:hypothetical protein
VSPDVRQLPPHRRPPEFGGTGRDPVWGIDEKDLGPDLTYRPDPDRDGHGFIEPARSMPLRDFQEAVERTASSWQLVRAEQRSDER